MAFMVGGLNCRLKINKPHFTVSVTAEKIKRVTLIKGDVCTSLQHYTDVHTNGSKNENRE